MNPAIVQTVQVNMWQGSQSVGGLSPESPAYGYVIENKTQYYTTEDGVLTYIPESALSTTQRLSDISSSGSAPALTDAFLGVTAGGLDFLYTQSLLFAPLRGWISGLTLSNDGGTPNTVIDIAAGCCTSDDFANFMSTSAITKSIGSLWKVGTGNGGLDTGAVANTTWYHVFLIMNPSTGAVDALLSTSATSPNMTLPNIQGFTKRRRIGAIRTDSSAHIIPFLQFGDEFLWKTVVLDLNFAATTTSQTLTTLTVPTGVNVYAFINYLVDYGSGGGPNTAFYAPDMGDQTSSNWISQAADDMGILARTPGFLAPAGAIEIRTNTSAQIAWTTNGSAGTFSIETLGWIDLRGKI